MKASEVIAAAQAQMNVTQRVTIRYDSTVSELDNSWRILFGTRVLTIDGVRNVNERDRTLELLCSEGMKEE